LGAQPGGGGSFRSALTWRGSVLVLQAALCAAEILSLHLSLDWGCVCTEGAPKPFGVTGSKVGGKSALFYGRPHHRSNPRAINCDPVTADLLYLTSITPKMRVFLNTFLRVCLLALLAFQAQAQLRELCHRSLCMHLHALVTQRSDADFPAPVVLPSYYVASGPPPCTGPRVAEAARRRACAPPVHAARCIYPSSRPHALQDLTLPCPLPYPAAGIPTCTDPTPCPVSGGSYFCPDNNGCRPLTLGPWTAVPCASQCLTPSEWGKLA
jgi:hypothetical protein